MHDVLCPIMAELTGVRERISRYYTIRAGDLRDYAHLGDNEDNYLCPALVILSARIQGKITDNVITFAELFQLVHTALTIHQGVNEDRAPQLIKAGDPRDGSQYPILVGDYLYSKAFSILVESNNTRQMARLSEIVYNFNEGGIIRNKYGSAGAIKLDVWREIIRLEKAGLLSGCCEMGSLMSGAGIESQSYLKRFGHALGMALGMKEINRPDQAEIYFAETQSLIECMDSGKGRDDLWNMVLYLMGKKIERVKMVC